MRNKYYQILRNTFRTEEVNTLNKKEILSFLHNKENKLNETQKWMIHKYAHSIKVLRAGIDIMNREPELSLMKPEIINKWIAALILHDIGRAEEISPDGKKKFSYPHGALGMQRLFEKGETSLNVLLPVLMHDQFNYDFMQADNQSLESNPKYQVLPEEIKKTVQKLRTEYAKTSNEEKRIIDLGCKLVIDADKLGNLREFDKMLNLSKLPKEQKLTPEVINQVHNHGYVNYANLNSYADEACAYMAWTYKFNFDSTRKEVLDGHVVDKIHDYTIKEIDKCTSQVENKEFKIQFGQLADYVNNYHKNNSDNVLKVSRQKDISMIQNFLQNSK